MNRIDALRQVEADLHPEGWNTYGTFSVLFEGGRVEFLSKNLPNIPAFLTLMVHHAEGFISNPDVVGLIVTGTADTWSLATYESLRRLPKEALPERFEALPNPEDTDDSREVRRALLVTRDGESYMIERDKRDGEVRDESWAAGFGLATEALRYLMGCHPQQNIQRIVERHMDKLLDLKMQGRDYDVDESMFAELVDEIMLAYSIHAPEKLDEVKAFLRKLTDGRYPKE